MGLLQEKFQVEFPDKTGNHQWVEPSTARRAKSAPEYLNCLPPGDNIGDQQLIDNPAIPRVMSGQTDVTQDWNESAVKSGYRRFDVKPTDDAYSQEHYDPFYRSARSGSDEGFVERNNMLDRI